MKNTAKIIALLLSLLMILPLAVACSNDPATEATDNNADTVSDVVTESETQKPVVTDKYGQESQEITEDLENYDGQGASVNILIRSGQGYRREWFNEGDLDALENEIHYRNLDVEEYLNVKLNYILNTKADEKMNELIEQAGKGGTGAYDIISNYAAYSTSTNVLQYYVNFTNDQLVHVDLTKPYWNQAFIKDAKAFDRLFVCVGDVNLSVYDREMVVFYNKAKAEVYLADIDLYQMVLDKKWTYDVFYEIIADLHEDNGTSDTEDDFYGVASIRGSEFCDGFLYSLGCNLTQTDSDGYHYLVTDTAYTRISSAFTKTAEFWATDGAIIIEGSGNNYTFFTQGHALFDIDVMYHYESGNQMLREMEDGFGIVPLPMYDEDQGVYYAGVQDAHNVMSVMSHFRQDYERTSAVLECLNSFSYSGVRPYYIEKIVKGQFLDQKSNEVFGFILDGARWDFADIYNKAIGGIRNKIWRDPLKKGETSIDTSYTGNMEALNGNLAIIDEWLKTHY